MSEIIRNKNARFPKIMWQITDRVLDDLRLLLNCGMDDQPRLTLILVGLSELDRRLALTAHQSLRHRLALAGAHQSDPFFDAKARDDLRLISEGILRLVNHLAHFALVAAARQHAQPVTGQHVEFAAEELGI